MSATRKAAVVVALAAMLAAVPFMFLLFANPNPDRPATLILKAAPLAAPVLLGVLAYVYCMWLVALAPKLWAKFAPIVGALSGVLTFLSFTVIYPLVVGLLPGQDYSRLLAEFPGFGLLLFGWVPIVIGGGAEPPTTTHELSMK
jgi:hypothetical protein